MREILFKAQRVPDRKWVFGLPNHEGYLVDENGHANAIYKKTLCQYIGQNDKNGKKIFEHDVMQFENDHPFVVFIEEGAPQIERLGGRPRGVILTQSKSDLCRVIRNLADEEN